MQLMICGTNKIVMLPGDVRDDGEEGGRCSGLWSTTRFEFLPATLLLLLLMDELEWG